MERFSCRKLLVLIICLSIASIQYIGVVKKHNGNCFDTWNKALIHHQSNKLIFNANLKYKIQRYWLNIWLTRGANNIFIFIMTTQNNSNQTNLSLLPTSHDQANQHVSDLGTPRRRRQGVHCGRILILSGSIIIMIETCSNHLNCHQSIIITLCSSTRCCKWQVIMSRPCKNAAESG